MASIAFIGLGNMGGPMALNLLRAGHTLHVFDLSASAVQTLVDAGAHAAASAAAAVAAADDAVEGVVYDLLIGHEAESGGIEWLKETESSEQYLEILDDVIEDVLRGD